MNSTCSPPVGNKPWVRNYVSWKQFESIFTIPDYLYQIYALLDTVRLTMSFPSKTDP